MKVIVIANQKGGVGKSTVACNLAICAAKDNLNVALVDADPQGTSMQFRSLRQADDISALAIIQPSIFTDVPKLTNFDLVLIDAGGRDNILLRAAITTAIHGLLLIPLLPSAVDIWATEDTFTILREARSIGAQIDSYRYRQDSWLCTNCRVASLRCFKRAAWHRQHRRCSTHPLRCFCGWQTDL